MQFDEVKPEHFSTISRDPFPHILIDRALLQISGGDARAAKFRVDALAAAGWAHSGLVPFGRYPDQAAAAFNRLRVWLAAGFFHGVFCFATPGHRRRCRPARAGLFSRHHHPADS